MLKNKFLYYFSKAFHSDEIGLKALKDTNINPVLQLYEINQRNFIFSNIIVRTRKTFFHRHHLFVSIKKNCFQPKISSNEWQLLYFGYKEFRMKETVNEEACFIKGHIN
jgi:hypothetical protein